MACGGGGEDNPFSFKNYMKSKVTGGAQSSDNDEDDMFDLPDTSSGPPKTQDADGSAKEENPFSFKKFLSKEAAGKTGTRPKTSSQTTTSTSRSRTIHITDVELAAASSISATDFVSDLPDFVQDHFNPLESPRNRTVPRHMGLPDFAPDCNGSLGDPSSPDDFNLLLSNSAVNDSEVGLPFDNNIITPESSGPSPAMQGGLPDFISDSNIADFVQSSGGVTFNGAVHRSSFDDSLPDNPQQIITRLREENDQLRSELREAANTAEVEAERVSKMLRDMEAIKKRENEETSALEKMVQQVEANLEITTARAVKAETSNVKLKQEVKTLKAQIVSLQNENQGLRNGDSYQSNVRERTRHAAQQLATAADTAQQQLQSLLSGVDNLRMLSKVLESIDRITEGDNPSGGEPD